MRSGHPYAALLVVALSALGCSWWIDPRDEHPLCERRGGQEVCPTGSICTDGRCEPKCGIELCGDNIDNDCDDKVDEVNQEDTCGDRIDNDCDGNVDEGSDPDGDGFTWCGNTVGRAGSRMIDCDPEERSTHPDAPESCDGRDNDCDGLVDEAPPDEPLCPDGQNCDGSCVAERTCPGDPEGSCLDGERCDESLRRCVAASACGDQTCGEGERCDTGLMRCVAGLLPDGTECQVHGECASQVCIPAAALRLASQSTGARVCMRACCSDAECGEGQRCFASGTGARSCLPVGMVPRDAPPQCTTDSACSAPAICALNRTQSLSEPTFLPHSELITSTCRTPQANNAASLGQRCAIYSSCASRYCAPTSRQGLGGLCSTPCGSTKDCRAFEQAARRAGVTERAYCRYITVSLDSNLRDYAGVCAIDRLGNTGPGGPNQVCSSAKDCLDGGCVGATATRQGRCAPTCCSDEQCGHGEDGRPIHCRPFPFGATYEMRCDLGVDL